MVCKYITKKGKTCSIKKVNPETGVCNKHQAVYLNKIAPEQKIAYYENDTESEYSSEEEEPIKVEKPKIIEKPKVVEKKIIRKVENKNVLKFHGDNELDILFEDEDANEDESDNEEVTDVVEEPVLTLHEKKSKEFQLAMLKMAYNTCTSIMESMSEPYLTNFSKQCSEDENISKCLEELNNEQNIAILMDATPEIRLLVFTGLIAVNKITVGMSQSATLSKLANVKTFEDVPPSKPYDPREFSDI